MHLPRLLAAAVGLALPLALATAAEAAPSRHHHHAARVQTATYKVRQHHAARHQAALVNRHMAQNRHHSIMRGS